MKKSLYVLLAASFLALSIYILFWRTNDVLGNLEASFIWATPTFVTSHVILHKKINKLENKNDTRADG